MVLVGTINVSIVEVQLVEKVIKVEEIVPKIANYAIQIKTLLDCKNYCEDYKDVFDMVSFIQLVYVMLVVEVVYCEI